MATVRQMIEWLSTLPADATLECHKQVALSASVYTIFDQVDLDSCKVYDYRNNTTSPFAGRVIVTINAK